MGKVRHVLWIGFTCAFAFACNAAAIAGTDYGGHWASREISEWVSRGLVTCYDDGSFRPDSMVTRAELMAIVNRVFGFTSAGDLTSKEAAETDWRFMEMAKAVSAGYIEGYPDGTIRPDDPVLRQEVAVILSRLLKLTADLHSPSEFLDADQLAFWSKASIGAACSEGYIVGYPDGDFRPTNKLSRAELVAVLYRVAGMVCDRPGFYRSPSGQVSVPTNLIVTAPGVRLDSVRVERRLIISESVAAGIVTLNNVVVDGTTLLSNANLRVNETTLSTLEVVQGNPTIVLDENSFIDCLVFRTAARVEGGGNGNIRAVAIRSDGVVMDSPPDELLIDEGVAALIGGVEVTAAGLKKPPSPGGGGPPLPPQAPTIASIDDVLRSVEAGDTYKLPSTVTAHMSNGTSRQVAVTWTAPGGVTIMRGRVVLGVPGIYEFTGTVKGYDKGVVLWLAVNRSRATGTITWTVVE